MTWALPVVGDPFWGIGPRPAKSDHRRPSPRLNRLRSAVTLAMALTGAPQLGAQSVRGQLVDKMNGTPISAGFIVLVDERGVEVARALTSDAGTFLLQAPGPGTYRLRSKRIGFRVSDSPSFLLGAGQVLDHRLEVEAIPSRLPSIVVEGRRQCGTRGEEGTLVAQLWGDAREALAAVRWTQGQPWYDYAVDMYERTVNAKDGHVDAQRIWRQTGSFETPWRSVPAESLAVHGYIVDVDHDSLSFYAPDPSVLLSDAFVATHCFSAEAGAAGDSGFVGLAFTPMRGRSLPDIRGVLWVSRNTAELRNLEYDYVNVPFGFPERRLGGREDFMRLVNGAWIVLRWSIRMAHMGVTIDPTYRIAPAFTVLGYKETGGQVNAIRSPRGVLLYSGEEAILDGTVVDSSRRGTPLAAAIVSLSGTSYSARSDSAGRFQLSAPIEGIYAVAFTHPRLDSLGGRAPEKQVTLVRGAHASVRLAVPPESQLLAGLCPEGVADSERVIVGVVTDGRSQGPVARAAVHASWEVVGGVPGALTVQPWKVTVTAESTGHYVLCGVPPRPLTLWAEWGTGSSRRVMLRFTSDGVWIDERRFISPLGQIWMEHLTIQP
jgi:carboxypeptidase family protein